MSAMKTTPQSVDGRIGDAERRIGELEDTSTETIPNKAEHQQAGRPLQGT